MAIVKSSFRVPRLDGDFWPGIRGSVSGSGEDDDEELRTCSSASSETDDADGSDNAASTDDADSGMESDEFDLSELGEAGTELCQVGNQSCSIPLELYGLPDLGAVLSLETWNECLSEEDQFSLAEYLPDMDQETFARTLRELFSGANFHFSTPLAVLFDRLKGGLCDPRVVLYRRGVSFFQRREYYHLLRRYQNSMVGSLVRIRNAFQNYKGYGTEERLRLLNILRCQRPVSYDRNGNVGLETDTESGNSGEHRWNKRLEMGRHILPPSKPSFDAASHGGGMGSQQLRVGKENSKSLSKVSGKQYPLSVKPGMEKRSGRPMPLLGHPREDQVAGSDMGIDRVARNQMGGDENYEDQGYEMGMQGDWNSPRGSTVARAGLLKPVKKHELLRRCEREVAVGFGEEDPEGYARSSHYHGKSRNADQEVTIASYDHHSIEALKKSKYSQSDWMYPAKDRMQSDGGEFRPDKGKIGSNPKARSYKTFPAQIGHSNFRSDHRTKTSQEKIRIISSQNEGMAMEHSRGDSMFAQSEETESDSSDQVEEDGDINPSMRKMGYPSASMEGRQLVVVNSVYDSKATKHEKLDKKAYSRASIHTPGIEAYPTKGKQKVKRDDPRYLQDVKSMKGQVLHTSEKSHVPLLKTCPAEGKPKGMVDRDYSSQQSNYTRDKGSGIFGENENNLDWKSKVADGQMQFNISGNRIQVSDSHTVAASHREMPNIPLLGCNTLTKKRKGKVDGMHPDEPDGSDRQRYGLTKQSDDPDLLKKKGKRKADAGAGSLAVVTPEPVMSEKVTSDIELETKAQTKPFTLITPSIHTGFSFSIIHLLSAVRKAMITPHIEDAVPIGSHPEKDDRRPNCRREEQSKLLQVTSGIRPSHFRENIDVDTSEPGGQNNLPSLTVQEIVNRVKSNPGDPCILETQEPLQDLVRGVLKIFSSRTAPLGAKGWKALVFYEKLNKSWTWVGPVSSSSSDKDVVEEETSSEGWGIPHKMLVKLVDAFANWLKCGQETLQQIGSLPAPPIMMLPNLDEKERFKDLRAQRSLITINPSSDEVRAYFRKEELLRYSVPDRAFSYTGADGKKSIVAPLKRGGGKPTSKARDHFLLKPDRPAHVTILCLVRDAAARLPGSIGTRADVCTLIRDSQYVVEDVPDAQVNQVVSGALDRLHYERDPCVQFDGERKLWVYRHRDREEEDFEDDGTSSTKKWKRQRKDPLDHSGIGEVNDVSYHGIGDAGAVGSSAGYDLNPDLNVDSASVNAGDKTALIYSDLRANMEDIQSYIDSTQGNRSHGNPVNWEGIGLNPLLENKMLCQENSTNEDFDDETFSREKTVGLLSASLL